MDSYKSQSFLAKMIVLSLGYIYCKVQVKKSIFLCQFIMNFSKKIWNRPQFNRKFYQARQSQNYRFISQQCPKNVQLLIFISNKIMKRNYLFPGIILFSILILSLTQNCCGQNQVRVKGNGETKLRPNLASIYISLSQDGRTASQALDKINVQLEAIYAALLSNGVTRNDITTSSINVYPKYDYTNGTGVIVGQTVYIYLSINIRGIDTDTRKVARVIDDVASVGASSIYGLTYGTTDPNAGLSVARKNAWNDALNKARQYAQLSGRKLGKVQVIDETNQINYYPYYYNQNATLQSQDRTQETPEAQQAYPQIPAGQISRSVYVIVTWQLI